MRHSADINIEVMSQMPDFCVWKKDKQGRFLDMNEHFAHILGFNTIAEAYGKNDYDLPTGISKFAHIFREADEKVMEQETSFKFLEIQPYANEEWKALYIIKTPYKKKNRIMGTLGFAMEVTQIFHAYNNFLCISSSNLTTSMLHTSKNDHTSFDLSDRQKQCLSLLRNGKTIKEIAKALEISPRTVEDYLNSVKLKLDCRNLRQLISKSPSLSGGVIDLTTLLQQLSIDIID